MTNNDEWVNIPTEQVLPSDYREAVEFEAGIVDISVVDITLKSGDIASALQLEYNDNGPVIQMFLPKSMDPIDIKGFTDVGKVIHAFAAKGIKVDFKKDMTVVRFTPGISGTKVKMVPVVAEVNTNGEIKKYTNWNVEILELVTGKAGGDMAVADTNNDVDIDAVKTVIFDYAQENPSFRAADIIKHVKTSGMVEPADQQMHNKLRVQALKEMQDEFILSCTGGIYKVV
jgi:hypothetical protein